MTWSIFITRERAKRKEIKKIDYKEGENWRKRGTQWGGGQSMCHSCKTGGNEEENKIAQFGGTGERKTTITREYFLHLTVSSVPKIKDNNKKKKWTLLWTNILFSTFGFDFSSFFFFFPQVFSHITVNFTCHSLASFFQQSSSTFPKAHTLSWRPLEQFKHNIKHMAEFMERKWDEKSNLGCRTVVSEGCPCLGRA